jgi:hypothetical protein
MLTQSRFCSYIKKDPTEMYNAISLRSLYNFFDWLLSQRRGKGGRKRRGTKLASSLGTYWKVFRLVYERAIGAKIDGETTRSMHKVMTSYDLPLKATSG